MADPHFVNGFADHLIEITGGLVRQGQRVHHVHGVAMRPPISPPRIHAEPAFIDARIYHLPPPAGPHLKANNPKAIFEAKLVVRDIMPRKFK